MSAMTNSPARAIADRAQGTVLATIDIADARARLLPCKIRRVDALVELGRYLSDDDACDDHAQHWERVLGWVTTDFEVAP